MSDNPGCGGWQYARRHGIEVLQFPSKRHPPGEHAVELPELPAALQAIDVDYVCLAGFLKVGAGKIPWWIIECCHAALTPVSAAASAQLAMLQPEHVDAAAP